MQVWGKGPENIYSLFRFYGSAVVLHSFLLPPLFQLSYFGFLGGNDLFRHCS
jgi:hypothetical protein